MEELANERWLPIIGYEGIYEVSSFGRIRSIDRIAIISRSGKIHKRAIKGQIIKPNVGKSNSYQYISLSKIGQKLKRARVHKIVALAFLPNPNEYKMINHKDGNTLNNSVENLEWCTASYNNTYNGAVEKRMATRMARYPKGTDKSLALKSQATKNRRGSRGAEIRVAQYTLDGELIKVYQSAVYAGRELGIWPQNIRTCLYGRYKTSGGFIWKKV